MSIYGSFGIFDGDEPDRRPPIAYQGSHVLPSTDDPRAGSLDLGLIRGFVHREGREGPADEEACWPFLRVAAESPDGRHVALVLDVEQVERLHGDLGWWIAHVDRSVK